MLLYTANISNYNIPAIPVMTKIVEVLDMINNAKISNAHNLLLNTLFKSNRT